MSLATPARSPALFQRLPERIFAPLASANRRQYWHLLCVLYDKRFGPDAPLPPSSGFLLREITADIAAAIEHQDWVLEEVEATPQTPLANRAYMVFSRLRDRGWLQVERLGVREVVLMPPAVAHFIGRLIEFAHTGPEFVSGKIRSIEANLKLLLHEDADGASLQEAARQSRALLEHIHIASTHVRDLMREIGDIEVTGEFVRRFFDDYVERIFIADYKELRTRDHPLARRQEILRLLEHIRQAPLRERLLRWYQEKQAAGDATRAEALFARDIQKIEELQRIDEYLSRLDDEIRRANRQALAYLDYRLRATLPLGQLIGAAVTAVKTHGEKAPLRTPFTCGAAISGERLARPRQQKRQTPPGKLRRQTVSPERAAYARLALQARDRRAMSWPKLAAFVRAQLAGRTSISSAELPHDSISAVRALQMLCALANAHADSGRPLPGGFAIRRDGDKEMPSPAISHIPFTLINLQQKDDT